jgi:ribosomal protein L37AE/L43A
MTTTERIELPRKPRKCPVCSHEQVARIMYGLPTFDDQLEQQLQAGAITLGGCCITDDDPSWECTNCEQKIYRKKA